MIVTVTLPSSVEAELGLILIATGDGTGVGVGVVVGVAVGVGVSVGDHGRAIGKLCGNMRAAAQMKTSNATAAPIKAGRQRLTSDGFRSGLSASRSPARDGPARRGIAPVVTHPIASADSVPGTAGAGIPSRGAGTALSSMVTISSIVGLLVGSFSRAWKMMSSTTGGIS
ncbi:MAG: hypothetical protein DRI79_03295 [Chloroflexi bacterium]|nr:MAG: hypothetical protein DRI79_03295 [Chloroflexota bacterium]